MAAGRRGFRHADTVVAALGATVAAYLALFPVVGASAASRS